VANITERHLQEDLDDVAIADDRYVIVSADGHAGAEISAYRDSLPSRLHARFDEWAAAFENPFPDLVGGSAYRNWDSARRLEELAQDGVVAEVLFPNTIPPFYPRGNLVAQPPKAGEHELRWEGLKAHNRWMADFCADTPGRRAGLVQILLHDVDAAVKEIEWGREAGLFGGVLLPGIPPDAGLEPFISPVYEPIWDVCEQLDMPLNHHAANAGPDYGDYAATMWMFMIETGFFSHRALWMLIFAGVFERHPKLKLVLTEGGAEWVPGVLEILDHAFHRVTTMGRIGSIQGLGHLADGLSLTPSEYYRRNVWIGSSFTTPKEAKVRHDIGVDRIMWGNDYPHLEATYPYTREALRFAFHDVDPAEVAAMLGGNASEVYPFDMEQLRRVAVEIAAPTVAEVRRPLEQIPADATSQAFEHLAPPRIW
jgi:predicted TIM-barrel fold metal-dependent hydrolase